ncbi:hypothetical protein [Clostridium thermarum]|uniref:hypothetical protein n=1 Tax=Clostridium thermarum TaxID=1716543 RepID=UPI0013CFBFF8|nr:hypothetical protein [Clostridium thermarum]
MNRIRDLILLIFIGAMLLSMSQVKNVSARIEPQSKIVEKSIGGEPVSHQQSKAQVSFFQQALDEFGATSLDQVIELWTKADKMRNGVFKYAVACEKLKEEMIKKWGKADESFWIIGGSSPWLSKYEVLSRKQLTNDISEVKIKYYWETSAGPAEPTEETLLIIKEDNRWCVKEIK